MNNKDCLIKNAKESINAIISNEQADVFMAYMDYLLEWNKKFNLTAITEPEEMIVKHFIDSISVLTQSGIVFDRGDRIIDVGSGAGMPGIPIKIMRPDLNITMLDATKKKADFLSGAIEALSLGTSGQEKIQALWSRAETAGKETAYREKFDVCVSRAVADLSVLAEICLPFVKVNGYFLAMKGREINDELKNANAAISALGGSVLDVKTVNLPLCDVVHTIIVVKKVRQTPAKYPRIYGQITKNPAK